MGFGFWKGKIEIVLPKYSYSPGEKTEGEIDLKMKKPKKARELTISLIGKEIITKYVVRSDGRRRTRRESITICDLKIALDGEKEYSGG